MLSRALRLTRAPLVFAAIALIAASAHAAKLGGESFPDAASAQGDKVVLNGLGLREATFMKVDVYVGALYLVEKSSDAKAILGKDAAWRIDMKFVRDVDKEDLAKAWTSGFKNNAGKDAAALSGKVKQLNGYMQDIKEGQAMILEYAPGKGTKVTVAGKAKGTIDGADFGRGLLSVWLGKKPPNHGLKNGMLGR